MLSYHVKVEFHMEIHDEEEARLLAAARLHDQVTRTLERGGRAEGDADQVLGDPKTTGTMVVHALIAQGLQGFPWLTVRDMEILPTESSPPGSA